jgi:hypothetical protein
VFIPTRPELQGFEEFIDENAVVCWRIARVISLMKVISFEFQSVADSINYHLKMMEESQLTVSVFSNIWGWSLEGRFEFSTSSKP